MYSIVVSVEPIIMINWFLFVTISFVEQIIMACLQCYYCLVAFFLLIGILGIIDCVVPINCNSFCLRTYL